MNTEVIHGIIKKHLQILEEKMVKDFKKNYKNKAYNWILEEFNQNYVKNMVFVSSFESKYGNMFEDIATDISKVTFSAENVPNFVQGYGVTDDEFEEYIKKQKKEEYKQVIVTKFDNKKNAGKISNFMTANRGSGRGKNKILPTMRQSKLNEIIDNNWEVSKIKSQPVDLIIKDFNNNYNLIEIKAGGNLDSSNTPGNIEKMLKFYYSLNISNTKLYFATLYNYKGENNPWTGGVTSYLYEDMLLISKDFWNFILPENIFFEDFKEIYRDTFNEIAFNETLDDLLSY